MVVDDSHLKGVFSRLLEGIAVYAHRAGESSPCKWAIQRAQKICDEYGISKDDLEMNLSQYEAKGFLRPITASVQLEDKPKPGKASFRSGEFNLKKLFPDKNGQNGIAPTYDTGKFGSSLAVIDNGSQTDGFYNLIGKLDTLLLRFLWNIPKSDDESDTSLYEHVRLEAAKAAIKDESYLLIKGDLSGIQPFIKEAAGYRSKGAAKRLRARSFKLQALVMAFTDRFTRKLGLTPLNVLIESGGNFLILASNNQETEQQVTAAQNALDIYFLENTWMETSLSLATINLSETDFELEIFQEKQNELEKKLKEKKQRKFQSILNGKDGFLIPDRFFEYDTGEQPFCRNCHKFPNVNHDKKDDDEFKDLCKHCAKDVEIGKELVKAKKVTIQKEKNDRGLYFPIKSDGLDLSASVVLNCDANGPEVTVYTLVKGHDLDDIERHRFLANWVPVFSDEKEEIEFAEKLKQDKDVTDENEFPSKIEKGDIKDFGIIARYRDGGSPYLGVLKADVDNLGKVFEKGLKGGGTAARIFGLSRMLEYFFSGWLRAYLDQNEDVVLTPKGNQFSYKPRDIYTIFSGGDDLALVGRWDDLILFAIKLREKFMELSGNNDSLTISCALVTVSPKYPVSDAIDKAEEMLKEKAKIVEGKNAFAVLDSVMEKEQSCELLDLAWMFENTHVDDGLEKSKVMGSSMLHRFLGYHKQVMDCWHSKDKEFDPKKLIYRARVNYEVGRNIMKEDKKKEGLSQPIRDLAETLKDLFFEEPEDNTELRNLRFPLTWAAYRSRGRKEMKDGQTKGQI